MPDLDLAKLREQIATEWLIDEDGGGESARPWAEMLIRNWSASEHCGDCTGLPASCARCLCDDAFKYADRFLSLLRPALQAAWEAGRDAAVDVVLPPECASDGRWIPGPYYDPERERFASDIRALTPPDYLTGGDDV